LLNILQSLTSSIDDLILVKTLWSQLDSFCHNTSIWQERQTELLWQQSDKYFTSFSGQLMELLYTQQLAAGFLSLSYW